MLPTCKRKTWQQRYIHQKYMSMCLTIDLRITNNNWQNCREQNIKQLRLEMLIHSIEHKVMGSWGGAPIPQAASVFACWWLTTKNLSGNCPGWREWLCRLHLTPRSSPHPVMLTAGVQRPCPFALTCNLSKGPPPSLSSLQNQVRPLSQLYSILTLPSA